MSASKLNSLLEVSARRRTSASAAQLLAFLTDANLSRPSIVLEYGQLALSEHRPTTREYWNVVSDIIQAAAHLGEHEIANSYVKKTMDRFPKSIRSFVLLGISQESRGLFREAMTKYIDVISKQPMAPPVYKRQVAVFKSEMKIAEATALLNQYLSFYGDDFSAWAELCALCLQLGRFSQALFSANELVLIEPNNFAAHITVADVYITCGGHQNLLQARFHYSSSLNARPKANLRALYGLQHVCSLLSIEPSASEEERDRNERLLALAKNGILDCYKSSEANLSIAFVEDMLNSDVEQ